MEINDKWVEKLIELKNKAKDNNIPDDIRLQVTLSSLIGFIESLEILKEIKK